VLTVNYDLFKLEDGDKFLDAGCGEGRHSWEACRRNHCMVCALDLDNLNVRKTKYVLDYMDSQKVCQGNWNVLCGDALNLPFQDASFDKIICSEVLEHVVDEDQGIGELVRVLKPGGVLAVTVPTQLTEAVYWALSDDYHNNPGGHVRIFTAQGLVKALRHHNLAVYAIRYEHAFHSIYWLLRCIFRVRNEEAAIPALYNRFLELQITTKSRFVPWVERILNFFFPKSIVIYTRKV